MKFTNATYTMDKDIAYTLFSLLFAIKIERDHFKFIRSTKSIGNFSAAKDADKLTDPVLRAQFAASFPDGFKSVRWYPAIPPGLEEIEGRILDRVKAAK